MKVTAQCIPCYLNQCLKAMEKGRTPASDIEDILISTMSVIVHLDRTRTPAIAEDAVESGISNICRVINNGNNFLGTIEEKCSPEFLKEMKESDLIISKGQANYESLEGSELAGDKTFFLLFPKTSSEKINNS